MKAFRPLHGAVSLLIDQRTVFKIISLFACLLIVFIASAALGDIKFSPVVAFQTIFGFGDPFQHMVVYSFRMPRILVALFAGAALAMAGAILQGLVRNPLASPDLIGMTAGGSAAVTAFLAIFSDKSNALTVSIGWLPLAAFIGAAVTALLVYMLAWKNGLSPIRLILIGIGLTAAMKAVTTMMMIIGPIYQASKANMWMTGSVNGSSWSDVSMIAPWTIISLVAVMIAGRHLNMQQFGDELAIGAGARVERQRIFFLVLATALVGGAVAFAGGIGFVGLMAPHIARRLVGSHAGGLIPATALIGAILVMLADLAGRTLFLPLEVPAGVFTAAIGAPYFIYLLFRTKG
ncbi:MULTISPECIES: iron ABC transporter permease [Bacillaceae]|uniref:Iron ABC transporter permease n=1 Tax=Domibacillus aminovorans TaxID=29332 RepID=A0A177L0T6_9BACI|nr:MULTISPECIES: iron ABC transporter permease [Bacillaceae]OAH58381.1 iron ABC transporter permease [Domibacillus aminovorans]